MKYRPYRNFAILLLTAFVFACSGDKTFNDYARAGDTVAVAAGYQQNFHKENITVTITPSTGPVVTILPNDPAIRASINFYADPLSSGIMSRETGIELTPFANTYEGILAEDTNFDKDWYQIAVFIDLPATLPIGTTLIDITNTQGASASSTVEIIEGTGSPSTFKAGGFNLSPNMFASISRVEHYTISLTGATLPYAVELILQHDPDQSTGGSGVAFAVNPLGYKKNLIWKDDGTTMKVIMTQSNSHSPIDHFNDYKFYVAGGIQNLVVSSIDGFDVNGNSVVGVFATSTLGN